MMKKIWGPRSEQQGMGGEGSYRRCRSGGEAFVGFVDTVFLGEETP